MKYDIEQMTITTINNLDNFKNKIVLEIGCGGGEISSLLATDTKQYIGIDPDIVAIKNANHAYDNVDFRIGSGESLTFDDSKFDIVLFTLSLHHQNSILALKEAYRVQKNDGKLIIVEPSISSEFQQFFHLFDDETQAIENAYHSMMNSDFTLEIQDTFNTIVRFEDKTDLCDYDFDRETFASGDENVIIEKFNQLHPGSLDNSPILLKDILNIYLLSKPKRTNLRTMVTSTIDL
jgi:ubiquinone/menaquinone biosynthesis C-methylase UbiE